ncbi:hypothetical protein [Actinoallomurus sp. CA-142502]|uniref:hypothetical protein n=1 Tax=Actinoallomurus sp. CA-142502 TaxID=3239885 RepID=UPI003D90B566
MSERLRDLAALLLAQGLKVVTRSTVMTVSDPVPVEANNPKDRRDLTQSVLLRATDEGLRWYLVRSTPPGRTPELEPLCPGEDIDQAAARIAQALAEKLAAAAES